MSVQGLVCLVTGGAGGLGATTARRFAQDAATVILADLVTEQGERTAADAGSDASFVRLDVTDEANWTEVIDGIRVSHGRLDILVNCAGASGVVDDDRMFDTAVWGRLFAINATGPFLGMKHAWPLLKQSAVPAIVNVTSISGTVAITGAHPAYGASKAALGSLSRIMAVEMAADGIRVNCVVPGILPVMSSLGHGDATSAQVMRDVMAKSAVPLGRVGGYDEVAEAIWYLASPASSYVTGTELRVDGGYTAR